MGVLQLFAIAAAAAAETSAGASGAGHPQSFEIRENVRQIAPDGWRWFEAESGGMRFVVDSKQLPDSANLAELLEGARRQGRSLRIRFTTVEAQFDSSTGKVSYPLCSVQMEETRVETGRSCPSGLLPPDRQFSVVEGLTVARAEAASGSPREAVLTLDRALASPQLPADLRLFALRARAEAHRAVAFREKPGSEAADHALVKTLVDVREIARLNPNSPGPQATIASLLQELGDYEGAQRTFENLLKGWPDRKLNATIDLAAVHRNQGNHEYALDLINSLVEHHAANELGMRFYYHRAWTLLGLMRFDEAIADLSEGLDFQPDYPGAFILRACAYASVGDLPLALSDVETAGDLLRRMPQQGEQTAAVMDAKRAEEIAAELRARIALDSRDPFRPACEGYFDWPAKLRAKSALLGRADQ